MFAGTGDCFSDSRPSLAALPLRHLRPPANIDAPPSHQTDMAVKPVLGLNPVNTHVLDRSRLCGPQIAPNRVATVETGLSTLFRSLLVKAQGHISLFASGFQSWMGTGSAGHERRASRFCRLLRGGSNEMLGFHILCLGLIACTVEACTVNSNSCTSVQRTMSPY